MKSKIRKSIDVFFACEPKDAADGLKIKENLHNLLSANQDYINSNIIIADNKSDSNLRSISIPDGGYVIKLSIRTTVNVNNLPDEILCLLMFLLDGSIRKDAMCLKKNGIEDIYKNIKNAFTKHAVAHNIISANDLSKILDSLIMGNSDINIGIAYGPLNTPNTTNDTGLLQ